MTTPNKKISIFQLDHSKGTNHSLNRVLENSNTPFALAFKSKDPLSVYKSIKAEQYDLIVISYEMPLITGDRVIKMLRNTGIILPIIAVSNSIDFKIKEQMLNAGADFFISKTDSQPQIIQTLLKPFEDGNFRRNNLYRSDS